MELYLRNAKWTLVPIAIACATVVFYLALFRVSSTVVTLIAIYAYAAVFAILVLGYSMSLLPELMEKKFWTSSLLIWIVSLTRMTDAVFMISSTLNKKSKILITIEQIPLMLNCWILFLTCRAYFGNALMSRDSKNDVNDMSLKWKGKKPGQRSEQESLLGITSGQFPNLEVTVPKRAGLRHVEILCMCASTVAIAGQTICGFFVATTRFLVYWTWAFYVSSAFFVLVKIVQMQSLAQMGVFFSKSHSNGFAWFLLLFGFLFRLVMDVVLQLFVVSLGTSTDENGNSYLIVAREIFSQFIPFSFHLFNVFQLSRYYKSRNQSTIDSASRIRLFCYLVVTVAHLVGVGFVWENYESLRNQFPILAARSAAYIAAIDLCFVTLAFFAPFVQFLNHFFNIAHHSPGHKMHFHRNMAWSACLFAAIHVAFHVYSIQEIYHTPYNSTIQATLPPTSSPSPTPRPSVAHELSSSSFITGTIMVTCFCGAAVTGTIMTLKRAQFVYFSLHVPLACTGFIALFVHGSNHSSAIFLCLGFFIFSIILAVLFFLFSRVHELEVDRYSEFGKHFILLSLKYRDSHLVPTGAFFNIYGSTDSCMSIFHCHSFPVFSTRNSRIVFLIQCHKQTSTRASFTSRLTYDKPASIRVQGPFMGPANSFLLSLSSAKNKKSPKCMFLYGWQTFSLLEYFRENARIHNIQSVNCMFSKITDQYVQSELHTCVENLVLEWDLEIPLSIVETDDVSKLAIMAENHDRLMKEGIDKTKWEEVFPYCKIWFAEKNNLGWIQVEQRSLGITDKVMYFCGNNLQHGLFPEPHWQVFEESS